MDLHSVTTLVNSERLNCMEIGFESLFYEQIKPISLMIATLTAESTHYSADLERMS